MRTDQQWIDHVEKIYNHLKCIKYVFSIKGRAYWQVECLLCHKIKNVDIGHVVRGHTKSCGCLKYVKVEQLQGIDVWCKKQIFSSYKCHSKERRHKFELSFEEFSKILDLPCFYCGRIGVNKFTSTAYPNRSINYNGIDRLDNKKGYIITNCMPCCVTCNKMKIDMPLHQFYLHICRMYKNFQRLKF